MALFFCLIQSDGPAAASVESLELGLAATHRELNGAHAGAEPPTVLWQHAEPGEMFTGGRASTTSVIGYVPDEAVPVGDREPFLRAVCELWADTTGCSTHDVLVAIAEPEVAATA